MNPSKHPFNGSYTSEYLNRIAFPLGGIGAGMVCMEGTGAISHVSIKHHPDVYNEPYMFSALYVEGAKTARILEGNVPMWKAFGIQGSSGQWSGCGTGLRDHPFGFPRFEKAGFTPRFPFGKIHLEDPSMPVNVELTGWSPFIPSDADNSSLPVAAIEFQISNKTNRELRAVYSFHSMNFMKTASDEQTKISALKKGFVLEQPPIAGKPDDEGYFAAFTDDPDTQVDCAWYRGGWFDPATLAWSHVQNGETVKNKPHANGNPGNGASLYVEFKLKPRQKKNIRLMMCWYAPKSNLRIEVASDYETFPNGPTQEEKFKLGTYTPWYAKKFKHIRAVAAYWEKNYTKLQKQSSSFSECFYDSTLPPEAIEAVAANLTILKSPTVLRQDDGRFWGWEGCGEKHGSCHGSCTHVWNYAQSLSHLFPSLERSLRETEFFESQDDRGHQNFRTSLPIGKTRHGFHAAADGQLGGLLKLYRDWRISGDTKWLHSLWPRAKASLDYCIETWDPEHRGALVEPHHNTYDIEFWGADGMCTSFYLGALQAFVQMGKELRQDVSLYENLLASGKKFMEKELFNGEYFIQKIQWKNLRSSDPVEGSKVGINMNYSPEAIALLQKEGPKYQYGIGCLSDGILGEWMTWTAGLPPVVDSKKTKSHLTSIFKYNFKTDLSAHSNPQRPGYAFPQESGLLACTWPKGEKLTLPFPYSDEVWTGIEYHVASHLISLGHIREGLAIVREARKRYDGRYRNPFNEYECGHWYARAMSSYALLQAFSGARYDAVTKTLTLKPAIKGDFHSFFAFDGGYGTVGVKKGKPFFKVKSGKISVKKVEYHP